MAERWRWRATGWLVYDDGSRNMVALDRIAQGGDSGPEVLEALIAAIDSETTWDLDRVVIELRSYDAAAAASSKKEPPQDPDRKEPS